MEFLTTLLKSMPGAAGQGLIWGIMAIGVYITYRILDVADLTVDGSLGTGGAVCVLLALNGVNIWLATHPLRDSCHPRGDSYSAGALLR